MGCRPVPAGAASLSKFGESAHMTSVTDGIKLDEAAYRSTSASSTALRVVRCTNSAQGSCDTCKNCYCYCKNITFTYYCYCYCNNITPHLLAPLGGGALTCTSGSVWSTTASSTALNK